MKRSKSLGAPANDQASLVARLKGNLRITGLALVVVVATILFVAQRLRSSPPVSPVPPSYGKSMSQWHAISVTGQSFASEQVLDGHFGVLLYAHRAPSDPLVRYLQVLQDRYHDFEVGLRAVLVLGTKHMDRAEAEDIARGVKYPVIYDSGGQLRRDFGLSPHMDHGFLVGNDGRVVLSAGELLGRHELRQHVEKHLLGAIQYAASPVSLLGPEAKLPAYEVLEVSETGDRGRQRYTPSPGTTVVVLPAALCAACSPMGLYERLADLYGEECRGVADDCRVELLVTAGYPMDELRSHLHDRGAERLRVFQAVGTLAGLEDDYFTRRRQSKPDALVLLVGLDRRVVEVSTLTQREATRVHN